MHRTVFFYAAVAACCAWSSCRDASNGGLIPVQDFFAAPERTGFKLSPDGTKIAYMALEYNCRNIFVIDLTDGRPPDQLTRQADRNVSHFAWTTDSTIVFTYERGSADSLELYSISVKNRETRVLVCTRPAQVRLLQPKTPYGNYLLASINERDSSAFDLYRIYLDGSPPQLVTRNPGNISTWLASPDGKVRAAVASYGIREALLYRPTEDDPFVLVANMDHKNSIRTLGHVGKSLTNVYALSNENRDKFALVEYNMATGREERVIFSHDKVDLEPGGYLPGPQEMLFASYTLDKRKIHVIHPKFGGNFARLSRRFEDQSIDVLDVDTAQNQMIVKVYSDVNPGTVYYYNAATDLLIPLSETAPKLNRAKLMPKNPITFSARDGLSLPGYLTYPPGGKRKNLPVVVLVHDAPYRRRESIDFDTEVQFLANRGYLVFQPNYRGSAGYGKEFWTAGFRQWGGKIQTDILDGVAWLIRSGIADKGRVAIMGVGFGGYSALYASIHYPSVYRCAVSMSGYTNLFTYFKDVPPHRRHDVRLFHEIIGDPVREAEMFKAMSPIFHAEKVRMPVLFAKGGRDGANSLLDANRFVRKVRDGGAPIRYIYRESEGSSFRNEENRVHYYQEVEAFLAEYL